MVGAAIYPFDEYSAARALAAPLPARLEKPVKHKGSWDLETLNLYGVGGLHRLPKELETIGAHDGRRPRILQASSCWNESATTIAGQCQVQAKGEAV